MSNINKIIDELIELLESNANLARMSGLDERSILSGSIGLMKNRKQPDIRLMIENSRLKDYKITIEIEE